MDRRFSLVTRVTGTDQMQFIRDWAEENGQYFPQNGFTNRKSDFPIIQVIAKVLEGLGYRREENNSEVLFHPPA
jgi:hypothetical protein